VETIYRLYVSVKMIFWSYHCSFYLSDPDVSRPQFQSENPRKSELERRPSRSASRQRGSAEQLLRLVQRARRNKTCDRQAAVAAVMER